MKTRTVWGYPIADILNEYRFYRPLLNFQRSLEWRSAINSPELVDLRIDKIIKESINSGRKLVSVDFKAYDASLKSTLQRASFGYIKSLFQPVFSDEIDYIAKRFNTIGLITPSGFMDGSHGVPSGSAFTNEVDSIAHFLCARALGVEVRNMDIQGDDGVYSV
jgi:hypothetical protein